MINATPDDIAAEVIRRQVHAESIRGTLEAHWEEVARRVIPSYSGLFTSRGIYRPEGVKRTEDMVDASAALALTRFAAAMESMLTPRNSTWHHTIPSNRALMKDRATRLWFEQLNDALFRYRYAPKANYASQQHEIYLGLGAFGTGAMFTDRLDQQGVKGLRYRAVHLGEVYFLENHQGIIDTVFRKFPLTARQAVQQFGEKELPSEIVDTMNEPILLLGLSRVFHSVDNLAR